MKQLLPLSLLHSGATGIVRQVFGAADHVHRLEEMGLRDGVHVEVVQSGQPCIIRISGHKLCFRDDDATRVMVESPSDP